MSEMETSTILSTSSSVESKEVRIPKIETFTNFLDKWLERVALFTLIISAVLGLLGVILRFFFGVSLQIIEELCRYSIIYGVLMYMGPLIKKAEHIRLDLLDNLIKGKLKMIIELNISLFLTISFGFLCLTGIQWVNSLFEMKAMTSSGIILMVIPTLSIPLGMFFGFLYSIQQVIIKFNKIRKINRKKG